MSPFVEDDLENAKSCDLAWQHLSLWLKPVQRLLRLAVQQRQAWAARLDRPDLTQVCVSDQYVNLLLEDIEHDSSDRAPSRGLRLAPQEQELDSQLRLSASQVQRLLPLDVLETSFRLNEAERLAILLAAAVEMDRAHEPIFAFVLDDPNRRQPCPELVSVLLNHSIRDRVQCLIDLSPHGRLTQAKLVEIGEPTPYQRQQTYRLTADTLGMLSFGNERLIKLWTIDKTATRRMFRFEMISAGLSRIASAFQQGAISIVGVWGEATDRECVLSQFEAMLERSFEPLDWAEMPKESNQAAAWIRSRFVHAQLQNAVLHIECDQISDLPNDVRESFEKLLSANDVPTLLTASVPWRSTRVLAARRYDEFELQSPTYKERQGMWQRAMPRLDPKRVNGLASTLRMTYQELQAVTNVANAKSSVESNGTIVPPEDRLEEACSLVASRSGSKLISVIRPKRTLDDLILPAELHRQIAEIASFSQSLPHVSELWGFGRLATGGSGMKVLFAGDPGTGKTMAAEVIAFTLNVPLLKVNIGQTVSKWLGETEKNLDEAFAIGRSHRAVLFFDEADALFGKRGEVRSAMDRFANTEISHLLQRLEDHDGLVILASNLKDQIDSAFTRRFHAIIQFPRPTDSERRRLWRFAFPKEAPLAEDVRLESFARIDMTGASIVSAARNSALLAVNEGSKKIEIRHIVCGVARQFQRESRVLSRNDLGQLAVHLPENATCR